MPVAPAAFQTPLQVVPEAGSPLALVGTFLLGWAFFAFTAQVAASFFLADPPWRRAVLVGFVPAAISMLLIQFDPLVIVGVGLVADAVAMDRAYGADRRTTALMVVLHYAATVAIVLFVSNLVALLSTAPG